MNQSTQIVPEMSLAAILNVLWRQWRVIVLFPALGLLAGLVYGIVVTPLYQATATIRPGMTAFSERGGASREWALKDVTRFYGSGLYRDGVAEKMGLALWEVPAIRADFISKGLQNIQGGNVITLSVLDPDPEHAKRVLDAAIDAFADYATADSVSNSLQLTRAGLEIQILERQRRLAEVDKKAESLAVELAFAVQESLQIDKQAQQMQLDIDLFAKRAETLQAKLEAALEEQKNLRARLAELEPTLEAARKRAEAAGGASSPPSGVRPGAVMTDAEVYRALLETSVELEARMQQAAAVADSLKREIEAQEFEIEKRKSELEQKIALARTEAGRELNKLRLELSQGIPLERRAIENEIRERRAQLSVLAPVERIGHIQASENPVRPRRKRAATILFFLGGILGIAAAFTWDYVSRNRALIFQR